MRRRAILPAWMIPGIKCALSVRFLWEMACVSERVVVWCAHHIAAMETLYQETLVYARREVLPAGTRHPEVVYQLSEELCALTGWENATPISTSALDREMLEPTYMGHGLAIPHARVADLPQAAVYLCRATEGIECPSGTATLIVMIAVPMEKPDWYLHLLSRTIRWRMRSGHTEEYFLNTPAEELCRSLREAIVS